MIHKTRHSHPTRGLIAALLCTIASTGNVDAASLPAEASKSLPAGAVAEVNSVPITTKQLNDAVHLARIQTDQPDTPQLRQSVKQNLIVHELFRQNAERAHYDRKPEALQAAELAKENAAVQLYLRDNVHVADVSDAQVKSRYDEIVASLGPEEYKPSVITVNDEDSAKKVLAALKTGQPFADLARQYSIAPSKTAGGSLPWVSYKLPATDGHTQGLPLALAQAIAQLPSGAVTPQPLHIGNVYVIARLDAKRSIEVPDFAKSKETLRLQLRNAEAQKAAIEFSRQQIKEAKIIE